MILFVVNEKSGNGRGHKAWMELEASLKERGAAYSKIAAESAAEAVRLSEERMENGGIASVVAVGGDGTAHSLLPLALKFRLPLGLVPAGSGNDMARALGLPNTPHEALEVVLRGQTRAVDVMRTNRLGDTPHYSLTCVATGLDGAVAEDVNRSRYKRWCNRFGLGQLAYIIGLFRMLVIFKPQTITVSVDGVPRDFPQGWLAAVANTSSYGGGLKICPQASPFDGHLHVCVVNGCSVLQFMLVFPTVLTGKHVRSRFVTMLKGTQISVEAPLPLLAYGDGEPAGHTPVRASVMPNQLLILTTFSG